MRLAYHVCGVTLVSALSVAQLGLHSTSFLCTLVKYVFRPCRFLRSRLRFRARLLPFPFPQSTYSPSSRLPPLPPTSLFTPRLLDAPSSSQSLLDPDFIAVSGFSIPTSKFSSRLPVRTPSQSPYPLLQPPLFPSDLWIRGRLVIGPVFSPPRFSHASLSTRHWFLAVNLITPAFSFFLCVRRRFSSPLLFSLQVSFSRDYFNPSITFSATGAHLHLFSHSTPPRAPPAAPSGAKCIHIQFYDFLLRPSRSASLCFRDYPGIQPTDGRTHASHPPRVAWPLLRAAATCPPLVTSHGHVSFPAHHLLPLIVYLQLSLLYRYHYPHRTTFLRISLQVVSQFFPPRPFCLAQFALILRACHPSLYSLLLLFLDVLLVPSMPAPHHFMLCFSTALSTLWPCPAFCFLTPPHLSADIAPLTPAFSPAAFVSLHRP